MYKHLIFDLDGTLVDTLPSIIESINFALKHFKKPYRYTLKDGPNLVGYGTPYLVKTAFKDPNCDLDKILKIYMICAFFKIITCLIFYKKMIFNKNVSAIFL